MCKLAREHVTVALSGDGGDELFGGYTRYLLAHYAERFEQLPGLAGRALRRLHAHLGHRLPADWAGTPLVGSSMARASLPERYLRTLRYVTDPQKAQLHRTGMSYACRGATPDAVVLGELRAAGRGLGFTESCLSADTYTYLPDDILTKVDVASMAVGLECRAPLLDHRLAELAARLPLREKVRGDETKLALKRALRRRLPQRPLVRAKQGFGVPLEYWFQGGMNQRLREVLLDPGARSREFFHEHAVSRFVEEHVSGAENHRNVLFPLLMLEIWLQLFFQPELPLESPGRA